MAYLDNLIFGARSKSNALRHFRLARQHKCIGLEAAVQAFVVLGTLVDLHKREFLMTVRTQERIREALRRP